MLFRSLDDDFNEENEFLEGLNSSERGNENTRKKYENKYMPPLPGMSNTSNKKKNSSENNELINNQNIYEKSWSVATSGNWRQQIALWNVVPLPLHLRSNGE